MSSTKKKSRKSHKVHVKATEAEYFTNNLATLLSAGISASQAMDSLQETTKSRAMIKALKNIRQDLDDGLSLASALEHHRFISDQTLALVRLGESSGHLVPNLKLAAAQEEKTRKMRSKIRAALMYPGIVLTLSIIIALGVGYFLLPRLAGTFSSLDVELPLITQIMLGAGKFLEKYGHIAIPVFFAGFALLIYILFVFQPTKSLGHRLLMHIPGISRLLKEAEIARFGYLLGTLLEAGLTIRQAFTSLVSSTDSPYYRKIYLQMSSELQNGYNFKAVFSKHKKHRKYIPATVQQMIIAGEQSGNLPGTLKNVGEVYQEKADTTTTNLEAILEPLLLVGVWLGVLFVAVGVIVPIYSLLGGLNQ